MSEVYDAYNPAPVAHLRKHGSIVSVTEIHCLNFSFSSAVSSLGRARPVFACLPPDARRQVFILR